MVIQKGAEAGAEHPIDGELILGREQGSADLVIEDPGVSRRHARLIADGGAILVEDLGSSNGTFANGERISGPVELAAGDEVQLGGTVLSVAPQPSAAPTRLAAPRRLAPHPSEQGNLPALAAVFLGPLSIFLLLFSSGAAFFVSLPCAVAAIVLGSIGMRNVDRGRADGHRGLAHLGRVTGVIGTVLSVLALVVFLVVVTALDATENSLGGLVDQVRGEIEGVDAPSINSPDVNSPDVNAPDAPAPGGGSGGDAGGVESP